MATREQLIEDFADHKYATGEKFERLINSMKVVQEPVADPAASGTSLSFIDSIEQDKDGKITATKKTLDLSNAHELNPFKGWWKTGDTLPTSGFDGAYLYFKDTTQTPAVTTIYRWNGTTYVDTGTVVDESNVNTFGSGQQVNTVKIKDESGEEIQGTADVLSAEAGAALKQELSNKAGLESTDISSSIVWSNGYVKSNGSVNAIYGYFHGEFLAQKGDIIEVLSMPYGIVYGQPAVCIKQNDVYTPIYTPVKPTGSSDNGFFAYSYIVESEGVIVLNYRSGTATFNGSANCRVTRPSILVEIDNMGFIKSVVGKNLFDDSKVISGYLGTNGTVYSGNYHISDYIPFSEEMGSLILSEGGIVPTVGGSAYVLYDEDKTPIAGYTITELGGGALAWEEGTAYARFTILASQMQSVQIEVGVYPTRLVPYGYYIDDALLQPKNDIVKRFNALKASNDELGQNESITLGSCWVYDCEITALVKGEISSIRIGRGESSATYGSYVTIDSQNITPKNGTALAHGLTLDDRTIIQLVRSGDTKVLRIVTGKGSVFETTAPSVMRGAPYFTNLGATAISVNLTFMLEKVNSKIWLIGDSYLENYIARWPYWIKEWGFETYMIDNLPGAGSLTMLNSFKTDLEAGQPQYAFWGLGMNDGTDTTTSNFTTWKGRILNFITLCLERGITPILSTTPTVPAINHESKNAWIRNSGFRYVDFAKAVDAQSDGTWTEGLLASDNVHPTELGAKVLATQVLIDFPEIMIKVN